MYTTDGRWDLSTVMGTEGDVDVHGSVVTVLRSIS